MSDLRPAREDCLHELVYEVIVLVALDARLLKTHVAGVGQQVLVVRAHVQRYGQHAVRGDAPCSAVQSQLANGDAHAVHAQVTLSDYQAHRTKLVANREII